MSPAGIRQGPMRNAPRYGAERLRADAEPNRLNATIKKQKYNTTIKMFLHILCASFIM